MTPEELKREQEVHRQAGTAEVIIYESIKQMVDQGIGASCSVNAMAFGMVLHADQLTAQQQYELLLRLERFIAERCDFLEADGFDVSRFDDLRWQVNLESVA